MKKQKEKESKLFERERIIDRLRLSPFRTGWFGYEFDGRLAKEISYTCKKLAVLGFIIPYVKKDIEIVLEEKK